MKRRDFGGAFAVFESLDFVSIQISLQVEEIPLSPEKSNDASGETIVKDSKFFKLVNNV